MLRSAHAVQAASNPPRSRDIHTNGRVGVPAFANPPHFPGRTRLEDDRSRMTRSEKLFCGRDAAAAPNGFDDRTHTDRMPTPHPFWTGWPQAGGQRGRAACVQE
jgi:hypothetical protein